MAAHNIAEPPDDLPPLIVTSFKDVSFLVIDDSTISLELMEGVLQSAAVGTVRKAVSVFAAAGILADQQTKTDCIICDHHMEGMTGLALLQRIRAGRNAVVPRDLKFIMLTGDTNPALVQAAARLDVNGFIKKPITVGAVMKTIHLAFGRAPRLKSAVEYAKIPLPAHSKPGG